MHPLASPTTAAAVANIPRVSPEWHWKGHNGTARGQGVMLTKLPLPKIPYTCVYSCSLHITCYPPAPESVAQDVIARWQRVEFVQMEFGSNHLREILRGSPIPWRANLDDYCSSDDVDLVGYRYHIPFFADRSDTRSGKVEANCYEDGHTASPCCTSVSFGGLAYTRGIMLTLKHNRTADWCYWSFLLNITSGDGEWLASLSRTDAAALVSLHSVARCVRCLPELTVLG